jgi:hypothetical protein
MWKELGGDSPLFKLDVNVPVRHSRTQVIDSLQKSGLPPLIRTNYTWGSRSSICLEPPELTDGVAVSSDGYPYDYLRLLRKDPRVNRVGGFIDLAQDGTKQSSCELDMRSSLGEQQDSALAVFERLLISPSGDCGMLSSFTVDLTSTNTS